MRLTSQNIKINFLEKIRKCDLRPLSRCGQYRFLCFKNLSFFGFIIFKTEKMYALYLARERYALRRERMYRDRMNPLQRYDNVEIKRLFRFERVNISQITNNLQHIIEHSSNRNNALSPLHLVCVALRFYATGCMQIAIAPILKGIIYDWLS